MSHRRRLTPFLYESPTTVLKLEVNEEQSGNNGNNNSKKQDQSQNNSPLQITKQKK